MSSVYDSVRSIAKGRARKLRTTPERSRIMRAVRQKGTDAELLVRQGLRRLGIHYSANVTSLPGRPDLANRRRRFAVFVNGCFWHRHPGCRRATTPKKNRWFWVDKFEANRRRDRRRTADLRKLGYDVLIVWECQAEQPEVLRKRLEAFLKESRRPNKPRSTTRSS
ncbi:MAG TPA: very short patch repair endonuclease [Acidobacteriaceae bacterium]